MIVSVIDTLVKSFEDHEICNKETLMSKSRKPEIVIFRHGAWYLLRKLLGYPVPFTDIGKYFKCDHSTIISGVQRFEDLIDVNDKQATILLIKLNKVVEQILNDLQGYNPPQNLCPVV